MPLNFSRFKRMPEALKLCTLTLSIFLMVFLETVKIHPPGTSMIWFTITISLVFDICTIVLLLKEYDISVMPIRMMPYTALECTCSIIIIIFYILSFTLSISSEEITDDSSFLITAVFCFFIACGYLLNLILNLRKWVNGSHLANPESLYDYPTYGSE